MHDSEHKQRTRSIPIFSYSRIYTVDSSKDISEKISTTFLLKTLKIILFAADKENDFQLFCCNELVIFKMRFLNFGHCVSARLAKIFH